MTTVTHDQPLFSDRAAFPLAVVAGLGTALLLFLLVGAVGVMAEEGYRGDLVYAGVFASVAGGVIVSRLRAPELAHTMFAAAVAMVAVGVLALAGGVHERNATSVPELLGLHAMFAAGFAASGLLFRLAGRGRRTGQSHAG